MSTDKYYKIERGVKRPDRNKHGRWVSLINSMQVGDSTLLRNESEGIRIWIKSKP